MVYLLAAALPAFLVVLVIYLYDRHKEPPYFVFRLALLGALVVLPIGWLEREMLNLYASTFAPSGILLTELFTAFFVAGAIEEGGKALLFYHFAYKKPWLNEPYDSIVYAVAIGMGFALVENIMYVTSYGLTTAFVRAFTAVPAHALFGIIMGSLFSRSQFRGKPVLIAYLIPAILHGIYDTFAMAQSFGANLLLILYLMVLVYIAVKRAESLRALTN